MLRAACEPTGLYVLGVIAQAEVVYSLIVSADADSVRLEDDDASRCRDRELWNRIQTDVTQTRGRRPSPHSYGVTKVKTFRSARA